MTNIQLDEAGLILLNRFLNQETESLERTRKYMTKYHIEASQWFLDQEKATKDLQEQVKA